MQIIVGVSLLVGCFFAVIASIGILRLPDLYMRMHAATKSGTVAMGFILLAVALYFMDVTVTSRVIGTSLFILMTTPIGAHLLAKAMLEKGYKMWQPTQSQKLDDE